MQAGKQSRKALFVGSDSSGQKSSLCIGGLWHTVMISALLLCNFSCIGCAKAWVYRLLDSFLCIFFVERVVPMIAGSNCWSVNLKAGMTRIAFVNDCKTCIYIWCNWGEGEGKRLHCVLNKRQVTCRRLFLNAVLDSVYCPFCSTCNSINFKITEFLCVILSTSTSKMFLTASP